MLNIVIPMAGQGTRFQAEGYSQPKPLIPVGDKTMIQLVIENLTPGRSHRFIFVCLREHLLSHGLGELLRQWAPGCIVLPLDRVTEGAACTVLLAEPYFNGEEPLVIANCDQWVGTSIDDFLEAADRPDRDGLIMTMKARDPKWSYVQFGPEGNILGVVEKQVVSDEATVGIYFYKKGRYFAQAAREMIQANRRVRGEFYVAPVYTEMVRKGLRLGIFNVGKEGLGMHGLGVPEDLRKFLSGRTVLRV